MQVYRWFTAILDTGMTNVLLNLSFLLVWEGEGVLITNSNIALIIPIFPIVVRVARCRTFHSIITTDNLA